MIPTDRPSALKLSPPSLANKPSLPTTTHLLSHRLDRRIDSPRPPLRSLRIPLPVPLPLPPQVIIETRRPAHVLLCQPHPTSTASARQRTRTRARARAASRRRPTIPPL